MGSTWAAETDSVTADWLRADYEPLTSLKAVPEVVLKVLPLIADQGEPFNATDVIDPQLPHRRFVFGGQSTQFVLICYEHGGFAPHAHLAVFEIDERPQLVFVGKHDSCGHTIEEAKDLVRQGTVKNDIEGDQEW